MNTMMLALLQGRLRDAASNLQQRLHALQSCLRHRRSVSAHCTRDTESPNTTMLLPEAHAFPELGSTLFRPLWFAPISHPRWGISIGCLKGRVEGASVMRILSHAVR